MPHVTYYTQNTYTHVQHTYHILVCAFFQIIACAFLFDFLVQFL